MNAVLQSLGVGSVEALLKAVVYLIAVKTRSTSSFVKSILKM